MTPVYQPRTRVTVGALRLAGEIRAVSHMQEPEYEVLMDCGRYLKRVRASEVERSES